MNVFHSKGQGLCKINISLKRKPPVIQTVHKLNGRMLFDNHNSIRELKRWLVRKEFTDLDTFSVKGNQNAYEKDLIIFLMKFRGKPKSFSSSINIKKNDSDDNN